ncbi:glycerol-3-phosphate dehydrogenase [Pseudozyma hubeiensis SY62]|uniref:Glycerol-3-phosphate dehydrogenase n=1 Tax=Pseudozyma hubeiensis (strain SY62) TaxID=1305764 RepID=R9PH06_PSEHS|nr:glycerol-3-phosphate dehydrogenase [Pseudozyma hubeiensis SY62]GAC97355.1 glycerol-3-phosphate dehydrogenase [Pseudozyma hubeiensis SY62]
MQKEDADDDASRQNEARFLRAWQNSAAERALADEGLRMGDRFQLHSPPTFDFSVSGMQNPKSPSHWNSAPYFGCGVDLQKAKTGSRGAQASRFSWARQIALRSYYYYNIVCPSA